MVYNVSEALRASIQKIEATRLSEMLVPIYLSTRRHIPQDSIRINIVVTVPSRNTKIVITGVMR